MEVYFRVRGIALIISSHGHEADEGRGTPGPGLYRFV